MKLYVLLLAIAISPFIVIAHPKVKESHINSTEKSLIIADKKLENNLLSSGESKNVDEFPGFKPNELHRIPVYQNKHIAVETITDLEHEVGENATQMRTLPMELPIPHRCPHITGTLHEKDGKPIFLGDTISKAAQRGCRFFIMNELIDRKLANKEITLSQQLNNTLQKCFQSCNNAYENQTILTEACSDGCQRTAKVTESVKGIDDLELEADRHPDLHRSFSIIIPLRRFEPVDDKKNEDLFSSTMPNALKMMFKMVQQMRERAWQRMFEPQSGFSQQESSVQHPDISTDSSRNSITFSRSMSVLMTKDQDGHSKVVVVHSVPNVLIHRFQIGNNIPFERYVPDKNSELEEGNDLDGDGFRLKIFGHLSNAANSHNQKDSINLNEGSTLPVYYYRSRLCYYIPRIFYLTLVILILYLVFWLLFALPGSLYGRTHQSSSASVAIISSPKSEKRSKFFFTKNQKYFQLNNKRPTTVSLPPPYPGIDENESCSEPFQEKQITSSDVIDAK